METKKGIKGKKGRPKKDKKTTAKERKKPKAKTSTKAKTKMRKDSRKGKSTTTTKMSMLPHSLPDVLTLEMHIATRKAQGSEKKSKPHD